MTPLQVTSHQFQNNLSKSIKVSDFNSKYFTYSKYKLNDVLVKETSQSKTVTLWRSWGTQAEARIYVQAFHGKTRTNKKPAVGKQTTITFNNSQSNTRYVYTVYIQEANKLNKGPVPNDTLNPRGQQNPERSDLRVEQSDVFSKTKIKLNT